MKEKILITGGTGFIGSHLAEYFAKKNFEVTVFDRYNSNYSLGNLKNSKYKDKIKFIFGDIRDYDSTNKAIIENDIIIHLAALIGIPYSYFSPLAYIKTNMEGTYNILESTKNNKKKKLIITSTSEVYGSADYIPIDEKHPLKPQSPYSASKIAADNLALSYYNAFNLPVTILRPFNTFGPRQSERAIIPTIINQILKTKDNTITLGNLYPVREFNYVEDICEAYFKTVKTKKFGEVFNVGNSYEISINDLVLLISKLMGKKIKVKKSKIRFRIKKSEVDLLKSDNKKIKKMIKWEPKHRGRKGLIEGLKKTIEWSLSNPNKETKDKYII
jgi:NAD dependent epimerase/dehydratase